jgi:D-proline reductase (dithiol) PrdB
MGRLKNRILAKILTPFPSLLERWAEKGPALNVSIESIPWTPFTKGLLNSRIAIVTTAGVHLADQAPFDMEDPDGDPTWRELPRETPGEDFKITHDYYNHKDADRDINIVYPIDRLKEMEGAGLVGRVAETHYGLMGHITGRHVPTLINVTAPEITRGLKNEGVDAVLLTPG